MLRTNRLLQSGSRRIAALCGALTIVALLAACGAGSSNGGGTGSGVTGEKNALVKCPTSTNTSAASAESGTVNLTVAGFSSSPAEDALVQQGLNTFMQQNPNIHVTWSVIPGDYPTKMRANIASGNVPDVFYVTPAQAQEYIKAGKLLNLSPYMSRDNVAPSDFYSSLEQPFDCANGTVFGIPKDWNALGMFYNKTMFQAAGLSDPTNWSWSDLQSAAQKLTKSNGNAANSVVGVSLPADASRWGAFLYANGGQMLSSDGSKAAFDSPQGIEAAKFYTGFQASHTGAQPSDLGAGWDGEAFGKQLAAVTFEGGWMIPFMQQTYSSVQYGIAPLPKAPNGQRSNLVYTNGWGAYAGTKHADAAWKVIKYMTGADYQRQVLRSGFALPTIKSLASDQYFTQNPGAAVLLQGAQNAHADFYGPADDTVHKEVANALQSVMLGKSSVDSALKTAAQNVDNFIQQNQAP